VIEWLCLGADFLIKCLNNDIQQLFLWNMTSSVQLKGLEH